MASVTIETLPGPSWQFLWDTGVLGGAPVVYCFSAVVSEHPLWLWLRLSFCVPVISCPLLRSLAEEEVKTEADVVEGMDASVRSKGKSLRPSDSHQQVTISIFTDCKLLEMDIDRNGKKKGEKYIFLLLYD